MLAILGAVITWMAVVAAFIGWLKFTGRRDNRVSVYDRILLIGAIAQVAWWGAPGAGDGWWTAPLHASGLMLYALLGIVFRMYYFCVHNDSPSNMLLHVLRLRPGMRADELAARVSAEAMIRARVDELEASGHLEQIGAVCRLRPSGRLVVRLLAWYRQALGWQVGG